MKFVAFDFDGTVVTHEFPMLGNPLFLAIETLKELQQNEFQLILLTMRSGEFLDEAVKYLNANGLTNFYVNDNPTQTTWTQSRKVYAQLYIDDAALGCPLENTSHYRRPSVDWIEVRKLLKQGKYIL